MKTGKLLGFLSAVALAGMVASAHGQSGYGPGYGPGYGNRYVYGMSPGMMGGYGMWPGMMFGGGPFNRPVWPGWGGGIMNYTNVQAYLRKSDTLGTVNSRANTVTYSGTSIVIDMVAVQPGHDDQTFEVHGLTNPTLVVPDGAVIHLNLVNMDYGDTMEHDVIITPLAPPYPWMAMMATGPGLAGIRPFLPWRSTKDLRTAEYAVLGTTFVARQAGVYWYLCLTPRHALKGMYGKFIVQ